MKPIESWLCLLLFLAVGSSLAAETRRDALDPAAIVKAMEDSAHGGDGPIVVVLGEVTFIEPGGTHWINLPMNYQPRMKPMMICGNRW